MNACDPATTSAAGASWRRTSFLHLVYLVVPVFGPIFDPAASLWDWLLVAGIIAITVFLYVFVHLRPGRSRWWLTVPMTLLGAAASPFSPGASVLRERIARDLHDLLSHSLTAVVMRARIVLAEDQAMVLGAFASLLDLQPDVEVVATAGNGDDALAAVEQHRPDVLLTDIEMPRRSGLDIAEELRRRANPTRVLIVTTFARSGYLRRAMESGVSGYVLKDAPIGDLVVALRRVHLGERVIAPELAVAAWDHSDPLTDRERELLREVAGGRTNADIASGLHLAEGTVRNYLSTAMAKLGARNRTEAVKIARDRGWI